MQVLQPHRRRLRVGLTVVLIAAGATHFLIPEQFLVAMPPWIPWHAFWIAFTGVVEIVAAVGLWGPAVRKATALALIVYFVAILPAHFHVALNDVPMFGLRNPWLWVRIPFQLVFIGWAWLLRLDDESASL